MTSPDITPPTVFERIRRRSSSLLGLDNPSLLSTDLDSTDDDNPTILPFRLGYLTPELMEEAKLQLNETEEAKQICLSEMRELIENEVDLVSRTDDNFLLQFLRSRKYNVKRAFKLLQNYFEFRKEYRHIYNRIDIERVKGVILRNFLGFLTSRDRNGQVVLILKFAKWDPQVDPVDDILLAITGILIYAIEDPATQISGFRIIFDCRGLSWKHVKICTPQNALLLIRSTQVRNVYMMENKSGHSHFLLKKLTDLHITKLCITSGNGNSPNAFCFGVFINFGVGYFSRNH